MAPRALHIDEPMTPPHWALLPRELIRAETQACEEFVEHYFDERGYPICVPGLGGAAGPAGG